MICKAFLKQISGYETRKFTLQWKRVQFKLNYSNYFRNSLHIIPYSMQCGQCKEIVGQRLYIDNRWKWCSCAWQYQEKNLRQGLGINCKASMHVKCLHVRVQRFSDNGPLIYKCTWVPVFYYNLQQVEKNQIRIPTEAPDWTSFFRIVHSGLDYLDRCCCLNRRPIWTRQFLFIVVLLHKWVIAPRTLPILEKNSYIMCQIWLF